MIYLDYAATAPPHPEAVTVAINSYQYHYGNPSSIHTVGTDAASLMEECRNRIAAQLKCSREKLYFCSSGTEANNIVISSLLSVKTPGSIIISPVEHPSVYKPVHKLKAAGWKIIFSPIGKDGIIDSDKVVSLIQDDTLAIFVMAVNNENGAIQPIKKLSEAVKQLNLTRNRKIKFHVDGVQALGKIPFNISKIDPHSISFSGHKIGAVRGSGLLYLKSGLSPIYEGGGQERGIRSGTENTAAIASLAQAVDISLDQFDQKRAKAVKLKREITDHLTQLKIPLLPVNDNTAINDESKFSPWIIQFSLPPLPSEVLVRVFNDNQIAVSGGSACSANSREKVSRVSNAIKIVPQLADSAIRLSIGSETTLEEIKKFQKVLEDKLLPLAKKF